MMAQGLLLALGAACAGGAGLSGWLAWEQHRRRAALLRRAQAARPGDAAASGCRDDRSLGDRVIAFAEATSHRLALKGAPKRSAGQPSGAPFERQVRLAGLEGRISAAGYSRSRLQMAGLGAAAGALVGSLFSVELLAILASAGGAAGFWALPRALRQRVSDRAQELERHLPEMVDVLAMGMRSGLSFDRSLGLYCRYFPTRLAEAFANAQRQWQSGLARRDDALRALARTYDSPIFARAMESIIRSLRFGSSLSENLEALAAEARASYRSRRQEAVAKAPIKIMVPTGTLILPAMLILVLGPVLLELMEGF